MAYYRCCEHCKEDSIHNVEKDNHDVPCLIRGCQEGKEETS